MSPADAKFSVDDKDKQTRYIGYVAIAIFFFITVVWSSFAPLESAALAPAIVQVEGKRKAVQHLEGGIVAEILVSNGDPVAKGEPLLLLDAAKDRAELKIVTGRLANARAEVDRLRSERDDSDSVAFSALLNDLSAADENARSAIASEAALFEARRADRIGEESVLRERIKGLDALAISKQHVLDSLGDEIETCQIFWQRATWTRNGCENSSAQDLRLLAIWQTSSYRLSRQSCSYSS